MPPTKNVKKKFKAIYNSRKNMKCLVIDKTKYVQELYTQNDKQ